jgi:hypothetical protein
MRSVVEAVRDDRESSKSSVAAAALRMRRLNSSADPAGTAPDKNQAIP